MAYEDRKVAVVMAARGSYTYSGGCNHARRNMGTETSDKMAVEAVTVAWGDKLGAATSANRESRHMGTWKWIGRQRAGRYRQERTPQVCRNANPEIRGMSCWGRKAAGALKTVLGWCFLFRRLIQTF